jgi:hypothetical protein
MAIIVVADKAQRIIPQKIAACGVRGLPSPKQQMPTAKQRREIRKTMRLDIL